MITLAIILVIAAGVMFFLLNTMSSKRLSEINSLEAKKRSLEERLEFMLSQRSDLRKEIADKERELITLQNNQEGIKTFSARELDINDESDDEKISRYLIQEGKVTMEQNEKIMKKMSLLKMDYIGTSLTLGIINLRTAQRAMKVNKVTSKSLNMNS